MSIIFTADWHLTDKPNDEYRWGIFKWLHKQVKKEDVSLLVIGGDLTDAKDKHSSVLVNRLVEELTSLSQVVQIIILKGNHDYIDEGVPFFGFASWLGNDGRIIFLTRHYEYRGMLFLPNTRNVHNEEWMALDWNKKVVFCHQTFDGCLSESGYKLEGVAPSMFATAKKVWSGDIHKPQTVGKNIEYVGAPYRIRFGDVFIPRLVLLDTKGNYQKDLFFPCQQKHLIEIVNPKHPTIAAGVFSETEETGYVKVCSGDQVKVRVKLPRSKYGDWPAIKAAIIEVAQTDDLKLTGPELIAMDEPKAKQASKAKDSALDSQSPAQALEAYAEAKAVPNRLYGVGRTFLQQALK